MKRELKGAWGKIFSWGCLAFALFQLYTAGFGFLPDLKQRSVHIVFALSLLLIHQSFRKHAKAGTSVPIIDWVLIIIILVANVNIFINYDAIFLRPGDSSTKDIMLGIGLSLVILEATRRATGWIIPALLLTAFAYIFVGPFLPDPLYFPGLPFKHVMNSIYYSPNGIYGFITGLSATIIAAFIIFGSLLLHTGGGQTFINIALKVAGHWRGGPAKVSVIASAMFGTISGSQIANVLATGVYTIPLMKRLGYSPAFAGAVEASASTAGVFTPPIMGSVAFLMAELAGIPYIKLIFYALIPCIIYYVAVFSGVHFEALRLNLAPAPKKDVLPWRAIISWQNMAPVVIPIVILLTLLFKGYSLTGGIFYASVTIVILYVFSDLSTRRTWQRITSLAAAFSEGGKSLLEVVAALVAVSMLTNLLALTGLTMKIGGAISNLGEMNLLFALIAAGLVPIVLGMGVTPSAVYVLSASICVPPLLALGSSTLQAHMFLFWMACLAPLTPPVCLVAIAASSIAQASWYKIAMQALRLSAVAWLIPFFFVLDSALLGVGPPLVVISRAVFAIVGTITIAAGFFGYLFHQINIMTRSLYSVGGFLLLFPDSRLDIAGGVLVILGFVSELIYARIKKQAQAEVTP